MQPGEESEQLLQLLAQSQQLDALKREAVEAVRQHEGLAAAIEAVVREASKEAKVGQSTAERKRWGTIRC